MNVHIHEVNAATERLGPDAGHLDHKEIEA
jgi:hypothetical protein